MRALLASPLGFLIGLSLGALGGGGSILAVPALVYGAGKDPKAATTTSLLLVGVAALVGMGTHDWGVTFPFMIAAALGVVSGSRVANRLDPKRSLRWFAALLVAVATYTAISAGAALL